MTAQKMKTINNKIPGILPPPPKNEIDGKIEDLSIKTLPELIELRDRQVKLLSNRPFLSRLADKGAKIQAFYDKIVAEINAKHQVEQTCLLFNNMSLRINKNYIQSVEWESNLKKNDNICLDSDDDSEPEDPLHILSQSTSYEKKIKVVQPEKALITAEDLLSMGESPYVRNIIKKTEHNTKAHTNGQFKPYRTTVSDVHKPDKEILRKRSKYWEVTAATPPPILHGPAKTLTLEESLNIQKEYNKQMKEIEVKQAAEKLLSRAGFKISNIENTSMFGNYRSADSDDTRSDESDIEGSDKEVLDEEPERGGVVFTVMK